MILIKAAAGLVLEMTLGASEAGEILSVRLPEGLSARPFSFEIHENLAGRLMVRPVEARDAAELVTALGAVLANQNAILAELRKYRRPTP